MPFLAACHTYIVGLSYFSIWLSKAFSIMSVFVECLERQLACKYSTPWQSYLVTTLAKPEEKAVKTVMCLLCVYVFIRRMKNLDLGSVTIHNYLPFSILIPSVWQLEGHPVCIYTPAVSEGALGDFWKTGLIWAALSYSVLQAVLIRFEMLGIAAKYDIKSIYFSTATVKNAVWSSFVNVVKF